MLSTYFSTNKLKPLERLVVSRVHEISALQQRTGSAVLGCQPTQDYMYRRAGAERQQKVQFTHTNDIIAVICWSEALLRARTVISMENSGEKSTRSYRCPQLCNGATAQLRECGCR
jgi:hypothetical protein